MITSPFANPAFASHLSEFFSAKVNMSPQVMTTKDKIMVVPKHIRQLKREMDVAEYKHLRLANAMCKTRTQESLYATSVAFREFEEKRRNYFREFNKVELPSTTKEQTVL